MVWLGIFVTMALAAPNPGPQIRTERVEYKQNGTVLEGFVTYDAKLSAKRPGVVIVHDWMGVSPFVMKKAEDLAAQGYTAFVADIYGKDVRPKNQKEAGDTAGIYKNNRPLLRDRVKAAFDQLVTHKTVDKRKMAAIGFCFGGMTALELGRGGNDLKAIVSFHGNLDNPTPADAKNIKAKVLVLHGADDPYVPPAQVEAFEKEMKDAHVNYELVKYPGAVHAFTNPAAGNDNSKGAAYNADADQKSNVAMQEFFKKIFKK